MTDISGPDFSPSSASFDLQLSLENKLHQIWDLDGSMEYGLTWKMRVTPLGQRVCLLEVWDRPRDGIDYFGWPTVVCRDYKDGDCDLDKCPPKGILGRVALMSSTAPTGKRGALNPEFCRWLMGFPIEWSRLKPMGTR